MSGKKPERYTIVSPPERWWMARSYMNGCLDKPYTVPFVCVIESGEGTKPMVSFNVQILLLHRGWSDNLDCNFGGITMPDQKEVHGHISGDASGESTLIFK